MEFRPSHNILITAEFGKVLKLTKNGKSPGESNSNSELNKYAPEYFKLRFYNF
jgi:hypothetical protein